MKKTSSLITYLASLVIGIILLALHEQVSLMKGVVIAMGILITVPSAIMFFASFFRGKRNSDGTLTYPAWYSIVVACAGLVLGIWMLVMPGFFESAIVYTLGVVLILVGAAQLVYVYLASRPFGANPLWYCIPILVIAGGFIVFFIGPKEVNTWATITTGILLIVNAVNGLASVGREYKVDKQRALAGDPTEGGELE